jgi:flagellar assembly protein FliH
MRSADEIIAQAHERAATIAADAERASAAAQDEARRAGREAGYTSGIDEANAAMVGMIDTMRELIDATRAARATLLRRAEPELVRLAVGIAERVLHQQIALDHGVVVEMAKAAIARIVDRENITVRVNPVDVERMREHRDELLALGDVKTMRVIEDQRVDRGGVILETDGGNVDAKISTQLSEVRKILHIVDDIVVESADGRAEVADHATLPNVRAS